MPLTFHKLFLFTFFFSLIDNFSIIFSIFAIPSATFAKGWVFLETDKRINPFLMEAKTSSPFPQGTITPLPHVWQTFRGVDHVEIVEDSTH